MLFVEELSALGVQENLAGWHAVAAEIAALLLEV
jgi:hypothetical protein